MGTRGAFGVIYNEREMISYNHFDSYPDGYGVENLGWLHEVMAEDRLKEVKALAEKVELVDESEKASRAAIDKLSDFADRHVHGPSLANPTPIEDVDWYQLLRGTQGSLQLMLAAGYMLDSADFPLDSLFCEWAYILDLDNDVFEVYRGFQKKRPTKGRWAGRPTAAEVKANLKAHIEWCAANQREPWYTPKTIAEYKAVQLVGSWPLTELPSKAEFLAMGERISEAEERAYHANLGASS